METVSFLSGRTHYPSPTRANGNSDEKSTNNLPQLDQRDFGGISCIQVTKNTIVSETTCIVLDLDVQAPRRRPPPSQSIRESSLEKIGLASRAHDHFPHRLSSVSPIRPPGLRDSHLSPPPSRPPRKNLQNPQPSNVMSGMYQDAAYAPAANLMSWPDASHRKGAVTDGAGDGYPRRKHAPLPGEDQPGGIAAAVERALAEERRAAVDQQARAATRSRFRAAQRAWARLLVRARISGGAAQSSTQSVTVSAGRSSPPSCIASSRAGRRRSSGRRPSAGERLR